MSGNKEGALKAKATVERRYGENYYKLIGARGGRAKVKKGFAVNRELASRAGKVGGQISRRKKK